VVIVEDIVELDLDGQPVRDDKRTLYLERSSPPIARFVADSPLEEADLPPMIKRKIGAAPRW
jgi:hypothetical protein